MDKYPLTIRLDDELMKVVRVQATLTRSSLGSVVVDAARQSLMPEYQQKQEQVLLKAMDRCFNRLVKMHEDQQAQHELVREMLAMFVRTFFRHTPAVKPEVREAATASAARRFEVFLDALATNRRNRRSVMDPAPAQEVIQEAVQPQPTSPPSQPTANIPADGPTTLFDKL
jgi:predicted transcriptional regulator